MINNDKVVLLEEILQEDILKNLFFTITVQIEIASSKAPQYTIYIENMGYLLFRIPLSLQNVIYLLRDAYNIVYKLQLMSNNEVILEREITKKEILDIYNN